MTQKNSAEVRAKHGDRVPTADMVTTKEPKPKHVGYRVLAALLFVLGAGGLFLGMLGRVSDFFAPTYYGTGGKLGGALANYAYSFLMGCFKNFSVIFRGSAVSCLCICVELLLFLTLAVAVVFSLVTFICAMASGELAKKLTVPAGILLLLSYGGLFLWGYMQAGGFTLKIACDIPTAIVAFVVFVALAAVTIARNKGLGFADAVLLAVTFGIAFFASYPTSLTLEWTHVNLFDFSSFLFLRIAMLLFTILIACNMFISILRICAKRGYVFDCVRFTLLFVSVLLLVIAFVVTPAAGGSRLALFKGKQLLYTLSFVLLTVLAVLVSVLSVVFAKKREEKALLQRYGTENAALLAPAPAAAALPAPTGYQGEAPMSEFERRMQALARGEQPEPAPAEKTAHPVQAQQPAPVTNYFDAGQYTYDPFINTLTPQEKNEFGDLFIAGKLGKIDYLPTYIIGGDNTEFFHKVFIYLGRFRKDISVALLDKLYTYVSRNS